MSVINELREHFAEIMRLGYISALLNWDQEVNMMKYKSVEGRSKQVSLIRKLIHRRITAEKVGKSISGNNGERRSTSRMHRVLGGKQKGDQFTGVVRMKVAEKYMRYLQDRGFCPEETPHGTGPHIDNHFLIIDFQKD